MEIFKNTLAELKKMHLYRQPKTISSAQDKKVKIGKKEYLLLSSNDYLGLASDKRIIKAAQNGLKKYGFGSGASRLISGTMSPHKELEKVIAKFKGTQAAILYNSGYCANLGLISAITGRNDIIISDKYNHASIIDAALLSHASVRRYPHKDTGILENLLQNTRDFSQRIVVTDGVFSMDGDIAPLKKIKELAKKYDATVIVDDAHATGILGENGRGTLEHLGIDNDNIIQMGTLGKAFGCFGAFVAGKKELIEYLINKSRSFIYSTALPPSNASAAIEAFNIVIKDGYELRKRLFENVKFLRERLIDAGFNVLNSETHIIPVVIGGVKETLDLSAYLFKHGVFIQAIRPPTVPKNTCRFRITPTALHTKKELGQAFDLMVKGAKEIL